MFGLITEHLYFLLLRKELIMVIFNELRIVEDYSAMYIDCAVEGLDIYEDMYIKRIWLDYYKTCGVVGVPSLEHSMLIYENVNDDETIKGRRIRVRPTDLDTSKFGTSTFENGIFYVTVECDGTLPPEAAQYACTTDDTVDVGVILDWYKVYKKGMAFIASATRKCADLCSDTSGYQQFVFIWHALSTAIAAKDYTLLCSMWDKFLRASIPSNGNVSVTSGCGCH